MSDPKLKAEARRLYVVEELSLAEISKEIGIHISTLSRWKNEGQWSQQRLEKQRRKKLFEEQVERLKLTLIEQINAQENPDPQKVYALCRLIAATKPPAAIALRELENEEKEQQKKDPEELKKQLQETIGQIKRDFYGLEK